MPKAILPENFFRSIELASISDERWKRLKSFIPASLSPDADERLRGVVLETCSWFLTEQARLREGQATAAAMRRPGKGQPARLERWAKTARMAADAAKERGQFHDDRRSDLRQLDEQLEAVAQDAERRLAALRAYGKAKTHETPWREFVRKVAQNLRAIGLNPTVTGEVYEGRLTWFQEFMAALQNEVLGRDGKPIARPADRSAGDPGYPGCSLTTFAAEIAKAISSSKKPGKARK
jgi:hypothetical protein